MQNNLFITLKETLKTDERFISNDGYLLKNIIRENAINLDEKLIGLLLDNETLRDKFFIKIKDSLIFDSKNFINFLNNKEFLENSFTRFKNKVGLSDKQGDFLASSNEIVLSWPYKDCILAGGQSKEDTKREEIFYNEILASDDIDRLLDEKVFTNFKRISKVGEEVKEEKLDTFKRDAEINKKRALPEDTITDNLLIKGNNLLALHSLKKEFAGKVKLIYIDPPYNTGNDSFKYNDKFNHSTWLTFMKNRLEVAKDLLKDDGVIFVQCDDNEQAYLKVLMDEVFGRDNFIINIVWRRTDNQSNIGNIAKVKEYITIYSLNKERYKFSKLSLSEKAKKEYRYSDKNGPFRRNILLDKVKGRHTFEVITKEGGILNGPWMINEIEFRKLEKNNGLYWAGGKNGQPYGKIYLKDKIEKGQIPSDFWGIEFGSNQQGAKDMQNLFGERKFSFPKPEKLLFNLLKISTNPGDIVLDYHLGSGTTCAVAHKMGRQYIGVEQMDYIETISKERLKKVIEGEQGGISKNVEWKGGGDFVYMEIMEENEKFIKEIECAGNDKELLSIYDKLKNSEFINYFVNIEKIDENLKSENNKDGISFEDLSIENKKRFLIELLDKNLLYKNFSEIDDENSGVSEEDKKLNGEFYK